MSGKKIVFLFLALLLPISIFLFLKFFGKNQFDVAPLYQHEMAEAPQHCNVHYEIPYALPDSVMQRMRQGKNIPLFLVNFSGEETVIQRVRNEADQNEVAIIRGSELPGTPSASSFFKDCVLLLKPPYDIALVDNQGKIRGYYQGADREEVDRMIVELMIILKKY